MGFFNKNKKQLLSGGNTFNVRETLDVATDIAVNNLLEQTNTDINKMNGAFAAVKAVVSQKVIPEFYLFQLQSFYFTNLLRFDSDDTRIKKIIKDVIKGAWLFGRAGIYKNGDKIYPIYISKYKLDIEGNYIEITYCSLYTMIDLESPELPAGLKFITIKGDECKKVAVLKWGQAQLSAWLVIWPFVKFQNELLTMIIITSYVYNKKWTYNLKQSSDINPTEILSWFDAYNFLLINRSGTEISTKFKPIDMGGSSVITPVEFLEYYENVVRDYYEILGRRHNNEKKAERNLTSEVDASQREFNNYEYELQFYFKIFNEECKELGINFNVTEEVNSNDNDRTNNNNDKEPEPNQP